MNNEQLRNLARMGAVSRVEQLREEEKAIKREFPDLFSTSEPEPKKNGREMSPAQRKAVSTRMKRYWASRRKDKKH